MLLASCRYLALAYAIGLAIGEALINSSQEQWQYAPLWVIDYVIVAYLLVGFWLTRRRRYVPVLMSGYALSTGVTYIAFFANFDPELPESARGPGVVVVLIGLVLGISIIGLGATTAAWLRQEDTERAIAGHDLTPP
jgi:FtsH-binding integral membrane protein